MFLHTDALGTPRLATDAAQAVVWRFESQAFGTGKPESDPDGDDTKTQVRLRFPGQYHDGESGLYYNWNRYYDPRIGRYITSDPSGLWGGLNTYAYVLNNPLRFTDPSGLDVLCGQDAVAVGTNPDGSVKCAPRPGQSPQCLIGQCAALPPRIPNPDLCTIVPDLFPEACRRHDECYGHGGRACKSKETCDRQFLIDMIKEQHSASAMNMVIPSIYYHGVIRFGGPYYGAP